MEWPNKERNAIYDYMREADFAPNELYPTDFLEVDETIRELSYLTHDFFRYYGKFPSKVAKYIIEQVQGKGVISPKSDFIFDNYNGSGTSLVEAKIAGFESGGIDINPFGVLASNVKTYNYNVAMLQLMSEQLFARIRESCGTGSATALACADTQGLADIYRRIHVEFADVEKWFSEDTIFQLSVIKYHILSLQADTYRAFFALGFFAIIRRVSHAYDAEVRPHVNPNKKARCAVDAFEKKIREMTATMDAWNAVTNDSVSSVANVCDNGNAMQVRCILHDLKTSLNKELGLVVSHPPYLNCFDYIPVYRLKFLWAFGFEEIYGTMDYQQIKRGELKAYPASTDKLIQDYFLHNEAAYRIMFDCLKPGGYCCVVIGDCTIQTELFSVHKMMIKRMEAIGFVVDKITYRSTSYGLGRYAYRHKADYNNKSNGKKDAILFFRKPV